MDPEQTAIEEVPETNDPGPDPAKDEPNTPEEQSFRVKSDIRIPIQEGGEQQATKSGSKSTVSVAVRTETTAAPESKPHEVDDDREPAEDRSAESEAEAQIEDRHVASTGEAGERAGPQKSAPGKKRGPVDKRRNAEEEKKRARRTGPMRSYEYWSQVVRKGFVPQKSERKQIELEILQMKLRRSPKKKFNFVQLPGVN